MSAHETTTKDLAAAGSGDASGRPEPDAAADLTAEERTPLLPADQSDDLRGRWQSVQASFVDEPQRAVADADTLVADVMQRLAAVFSEERERLESQWSGGGDVSTEELRVALTRYRSFFDRLLST